MLSAQDQRQLDAIRERQSERSTASGGDIAEVDFLLRVARDRDAQFDEGSRLLTEAAATIERIAKDIPLGTNESVAMLRMVKIRAETYRDAALLLHQRARRTL